MRGRPLILALVLLLVATACEVGDDERDELRAAIERWQDAGLDDYGFSLSYHCECQRGGRFEIVVHDDTVTSAVRVGGEVPEAFEIPAMTVDEIFDLIDEALDDDPDHVDLDFDDELGYPLVAGFDPEKDFVDDEWSLAITELAELERL